MAKLRFPRVSIIILNWNGWRDTIKCLESLYRISYPNYDVIVVDNGSQDESIQKIKEYAEGKIKIDSKFFEYNPNNKPIKVFEISEDEAKQGKFNKPLYEKFDVDRRMILIKNKDNYGFTGGNNIGIKFALIVLNPDYILLLNNDTVVNKKFLIEMVKVAERDEKIGIIQSKILSINNTKEIDAVGIGVSKYGRVYQIGYKEKDVGQYDTVQEIFGACACSALYRSIMFDQVGLFDRDFFIYYEDVDISWRARLFGWKCFYVPTSIVYHVHSASGSSIKQYFLARNKIFYLLKNAPLYMVVFGILALLATIIKEKNEIKFMKIKGVVDAFNYIPKMLEKRKKLQSLQSIDNKKIKKWFK